MMMSTERRAMIPPGYHFVPSDEELISLYLLKASMGLPMPSIREISERDLYGDKVDPWDVLSDVYWDTDHDHMESKSKHRVTYVVTTLSRGDGKTRAARRTRTGTWKGQTSGTAIHNESGELIGMRKMFSFMTTDHKKEKGSDDDRWIMHEYTLAGISLKNYDGLKNKDLVLCRIKHVFKDNKQHHYHYHYPILQESSANNNKRIRLVDEEDQEEEEEGIHVQKMQKQQSSTLISSEDAYNMIDWNAIDWDRMEWSTLAKLTTCSSDDLDCLGLGLGVEEQQQQPQHQYQFPKRLGIC